MLTVCKQMFSIKCQHPISFFQDYPLHLCKVIQINSSFFKQIQLYRLIDMVAGQQLVNFKDILMRKVCRFIGDSLVFAAGCVLTVSDSPANRQKAANDFFFLVNSCLMYSASWMHSASSDVAQPHGLYVEGACCRKAGLQKSYKKKFDTDKTFTF